MGIIDKATYALTCSCGNVEAVAVSQYGSGYAAGNWQSGASMKNFSVSWSEPQGLEAPKIVSSTCNICGSVPDISVS